MNKFKVGNRVGYADSEDLYLWNENTNIVQYGKVIQVLSNGNVLVEWDYDHFGEKVHEMDSRDLFFEEELKSKISALEVEFNSFAGQIEVKVNEATKLLKEAASIASKHGYTLSEMKLASPMLGALKKAGWRTSC